MMLSKIFKHQKAMTPLMIGLIVTASVIAVFFIIMAAVIPFIKSPLQMSIIADNVYPVENSTTMLRFRVVSDFKASEVWRVEIYNNESVLYGYTNVTELLNRSQMRFIFIDNFTATDDVPPAEKSSGLLIFVNNQEYTLRVYYREQGSTEVNIYTEKEFTFKL